MKGIINRDKNWFRLEETTVPVKEELSAMEVTLEGGEKAKFKDLDAAAKNLVIANLEQSANALLRAFNGETRPDTTIRGLVKNVLNEGTFGSIFSTAVEVFMMNYIKPQLIATNYLATTIPVGPTLNRTMIAMVRGFGMTKIGEVPRYGSYPTLQPSLNDYANQIAFDVKTYGVKIEADKDLMNSDEFGVMGFLMTSIADGFRYRKEEEVIRLVNSMGKIMYNNSDPSNSVFKVTTSGRSINGTHNGTVTLEDILRVMSYASMRSQDIGIMMIHPFVLFEMFGDSELRTILGTANMVGRLPSTPFDAGWNHPLGEDWAIRMRTYGADNVGNPGSVFNWGQVVGSTGVNGVDPYSAGLNTTQAYMAMRAQIPGASLTVVVTPQVPIRRAVVGGRNVFVTNLYFVSNKKPVAVLQEQAPGMLEWEDIEKEVTFMAFREKFTVIPLNQGRGVYVMKDVVIDKNYSNFQAQYNVSALTEPGTSAISIT